MVSFMPRQITAPSTHKTRHRACHRPGPDAQRKGILFKTLHTSGRYYESVNLAHCYQPPSLKNFVILYRSVSLVSARSLQHFVWIHVRTRARCAAHLTVPGLFTPPICCEGSSYDAPRYLRFSFCATRAAAAAESWTSSWPTHFDISDVSF